MNLKAYLEMARAALDELHQIRRLLEQLLERDGGRS